MRTLLVLCFVTAYGPKEIFSGFCRSHRHLPPHCEERAELNNRTDKVLCTGEFDHSYTSLTKLKILVICNVAAEGFDPRLISKFPHLYRFTLIKSNITHFTHPFPEHLHLQVLNLTRLELHQLHSDVFGNLKHLKIMDLSYNKLRSFGKHHSGFLKNLTQLYLRGNNLDCNLDLKWIVGKRNTSLSKRVVDLQQIVCSNEPYDGKPALVVMNWMKNLETECPRWHNGAQACNCSLNNVVDLRVDTNETPKAIASHGVTNKGLSPVITVNCSYMGFTELPAVLPHNTTFLVLIGNQISDVTPLLNNPWYQSVAEIYLDNNRISAVDQLERADWLSSFRAFSLRGNNLTRIPSYAFDYAFEKNEKYDLYKVYLGNNPWVCDCSFTPGFQKLLRKYSKNVRDMDDIRCATSTLNNLNSHKVIRDLALRSICRDPAEFPLSSWDILNIILITLILLIYINLIYDYWVYKTTSKLPWIATKLP